MKASAVLARCIDILQDTTSVRWPEPELIRYLNDAQREVVKDRPDSSAVNSPMQLVSGTKQTIPSLGMRLIEVVRNMGPDGETPGRAVRIVDREILDAQHPNWHFDDPSNVVKHYAHDNRDPRHFYVYPPIPALAQVYLEVVYSSAPTEIVSGTDDLSLDDIYANALIDYTLYRAYSKDSEYTGNANRATSHYQAYQQSLGLKTQVDWGITPNRNAHPEPGLR